MEWQEKFFEELERRFGAFEDRLNQITGNCPNCKTELSTRISEIEKKVYYAAGGVGMVLIIVNLFLAWRG